MGIMMGQRLLLALLLGNVGSSPSWSSPSRSSPSPPALVLQVVIPKTGTTSLRYTLKPFWDLLFANVSDEENAAAAKNLANSAGNSTFLSFPPFLAGDCESPKHDGMRRCCSSKWFPCIQGPSCHYHSPAHHAAYSELVGGFLPERGLGHVSSSAVLHFTILREPIARVVSEFHQWKRGWCCNWFYSKDLMAKRESITLLEFVAHPDCPALNRQTWMLADFKHQRSAGGVSNFQRFFGEYYYQHSANYTARLNQDYAILESAMGYLQRPNVVVGLTEQLHATLALVLFSVLPSASRSLLFTKTRTVSSTAGRRMHERREASLTDECWRINAIAGFKGQLSPKSKFIRHDRKASYRSTSDEEIGIIRQRSALDGQLYVAGVKIHEIDLKKNQLCIE